MVFMDGTPFACRHLPVEVAGLSVVACAECGTVQWFGRSGPLDPAEAMNRVFGQYDLVGRLPSLRGPADWVLVYRPPGRRLRSHLAAFQPGVWFRVDDELWLCHDGEMLLLAPSDPLLAANLARGTAAQRRIEPVPG
jgi:hypothetical protein